MQEKTDMNVKLWNCHTKWAINLQGWWEGHSKTYRDWNEYLLQRALLRSRYIISILTFVTSYFVKIPVLGSRWEKSQIVPKLTSTDAGDRQEEKALSSSIDMPKKAWLLGITAQIILTGDGMNWWPDKWSWQKMSTIHRAWKQPYPLVECSVYGVVCFPMKKDGALRLASHLEKCCLVITSPLPMNSKARIGYS